MTAAAGNVVGSAYVELRPKTDGFEEAAEKQLSGPAERMASRVGSRVGTVMGKGIAAALSHPGVTAGIGGGLLLAQKLADDQQASQGKLAAAFDSTGKSIANYQQQVDAAVERNEKLAVSESTTKDRLSQLTLALNDPAKALKELSTAQDIAAGTGRSFQSVVELLRRANQGDVSAYAQLGEKVKDLTKARKDLQAAERDSATTAERESKARESFNDKLEVYKQSTHHTLTQQLELYRAHQKAEAAEKAHADATARVAQAQKEARSAAYDQAQAQQRITDKYKGQDQAASGFFGHLKVLATQGKDDIGSFAQKYGATIGGVGLALQGLAGGTRIVGDAFRRMRNVQIAASAEGAAGVAAGAATAEAAMVGEAVVAEASASRIKVAMGGAATAVGLLVAALANVKVDPKRFGPLLDDPKVRQALGLGPDDTEPGIEAALGAGTSNYDDDKLAQQRAKHTATVDTSGSKLGKAAAKATGDSFADFLKKYDLGSPINAALEAAHQKAIDAAQKLVNDVTSKLDQAKSKLDSDVSAMRSEMQQVASIVTQGSTLADAFNDPHNAARNPFGDKPGGRGGIKSVEAFLHTRAVLIARFAKALNQLRKRGLAPALVEEIAQLGVDDGLRVAEEILSASAADVRTLNLESQQIARAANAVGAGVAKADFGSVIAADKANADRIERQLQAANAKLERITRNPASVDVTVAKSGASATEVGQEVGSAIRQAIKGM